MDIIKINGSTAELRTDYGALKRIIAQNVKYAEINPIDNNMILVTRTNGDVDILDSFGAVQRRVADKANMAKFNGNELTIYKNDGKIEIKDIYGALLRIM